MVAKWLLLGTDVARTPCVQPNDGSEMWLGSARKLPVLVGFGTLTPYP